MRLLEAKIKEAIVHPEKMVRQVGLLYFTGSFSRDKDVMPRAIQAVETFGRKNAFQYAHLLINLAQTETTVDWCIRELSRNEDESDDQGNYFPSISRILTDADPQLLIPRAKDILQAPGFSNDQVEVLQDHLELATWDADRLWTELETSANDKDSSHAIRVVEALARKGEKFVDRILELLAHEIDDFESDPLAPLEAYLVMLAGEMRLQEAIPLVIKKLYFLGDILSDDCVVALAKIGTDAAAEAVAEGWPETEWDYRLYASSVLEKIHCDASVRLCLELLPKDKHLDIRTNLAYALLSQFATEGIEPVHAMVNRRAYDPTVADLKGRLVAVSTILGVDFPERLIWKRESEQKQAKTEQRIREMHKYELRPNSAEKRIDLSKPLPFLRTQKQVGRNDPCPCGSGKKFKKCCMVKAKHN